MTINEKMKVFFTANLLDKDYIIKKKAVTLMYYLIITLIVMTIIPVLFSVIMPKAFFQTLIASLLIIFIIVISLFSIRRGKYNTAADIMTGFFTIVAVLSQFSQLFGDPSTSYTAYIFFWFVVIIQATLFNRKQVIYIVSLLFLSANVLYFLLVKGLLEGKIRELSQVGFVDSSFCLFIAFILSILIKQITDDAIITAKKETEMNIMQVNKIQQIMDSMKTSMQKLSMTSQGLSEISKNVFDNSSSQASSIEEIIATMEEVSAGIDGISERTGSQTSDMTILSEKVHKLSDTMNDMETKIATATSNASNVTKIARSGEESMNSLNRNMNIVSESSAKMTDIIDMIRDISDQINLLSLNAAIEAARAGDSGRGFAVVADEVSKLADRTAQSLKEIYRLIDTSVTEIDHGSEIRQETVKLFNEIINGVESISSIVNDISQFMQLQKSINNDVNENVTQIKNQSREISGAMAEQKSAVTEMVTAIISVNDSAQKNTDEANRLLTESERATLLAAELESSAG